MAAALAALVLVGCTPPPKKPAEPEPDPVPKNGVVGLVTETKVRDIGDSSSLMGALGSIFTGNTDQAVASTYWEVTVFYDDGTTGVLKFDRRPTVLAGQKVRVTGNKIELRR
jgi:hypothetical protein